MVICVVNQKGGVGKTTTSVNVAVDAASRGIKVLLIDLDPQGNATSGLGVTRLGEPTLYQSLAAAVTDETQIPAAPHIVRNVSGDLYLIGASPELAGAELDLADNESRDALRRVFQTITNNYQLVIVDTPPSLSLLTVCGFVAADQLLVPVQCEYYALEGLGQLLRTFEMVKQALNPELKILGLVRTMYDTRVGLSRHVSNELQSHFPQLIFRSIIPRNVKLAEAPSYGQPISVYDPLSQGAKAYRRLTSEICDRLNLPITKK